MNAWQTTLVIVAAALAGLWARRAAWVTRVRERSMLPSLTPGRWAWTTRLDRPSDLRRGDVVVLTDPDGRRVVKRVVGLPGERLVVEADRLLVDGRVVGEPYVTHRGGPTGRYAVPAGAYLVLGDNRPESADSRAWSPSAVPAARILGRLAPRGRDREGFGAPR